MDLAIIYSQAVEVKILENVPLAVPSFISRSTTPKQNKRTLSCQIWARSNAFDMSELAKHVEEKMNTWVMEKDFNDCHQIYTELKSKLDPTIELAVRLQDLNKWSQVGDFEPR